MTARSAASEAPTDLIARGRIAFDEQRARFEPLKPVMREPFAGAYAEIERACVRKVAKAQAIVVGGVE